MEPLMSAEPTSNDRPPSSSTSRMLRPARTIASVVALPAAAAAASGKPAARDSLMKKFVDPPPPFMIYLPLREYIIKERKSFAVFTCKKIGDNAITK